MASPPRSGCCLLLPSGREAYLPLLSVSAQVHITDVLARVTLTQHFANTNRSGASATARYVFPVPAGGAVCAFEMRTADGRVVVGEVKEAHRAEIEYKEAVAHNKFAGLLAQATSDVFEMSMGAIPPRQAIKTTLTYVTELSDDELLKQVRFSLPTYIGERYGASPSVTRKTDSSTKYAQFTLSAEIQMTSAIEKVVSPSHAVKVTTHSSNDSMSRCSVILDSSTSAYLDKDFVLSVKASKVDAPRCVAEVLENKHSVALSLTLVPRFGVKPIDSQEYIFVIDRSGSMQGSKIDYARKALLVMLKSLPATGTTFNIFSFGTSHSALWQASQPYSPTTLNTAVIHADSMGANMGGTEIGSVLNSVLKTRTTAKPTSVFVLTDGEVWDVDPLLESLRTSVKSTGDSSSGTYLRFFTLGIGHGASTALCNGLARAGNGLCLMTTQSEELAGKCARLLRASRVPPSGNLQKVRIDWGYAGPNPLLSTDIAKASQHTAKAPQPAAALNLFDEDHDPLAPTGDTGFPIELPATTDIQQAPSTVPDFYPGNRFIVSAILSKTIQVPKSVVLRGETPDGQATEFNIPVHLANFQKPWPPLVHTLAARRIIQELEDGFLDCLGIAGNADSYRSEEIAKAAIVRYSTEFQLASKYASFIAVEKETEDTSIDESDFEILGESDIDPDDWVEDFGTDTSDTLQTSDEQDPASAYRSSQTGYSRAQHVAEQEKQKSMYEELDEELDDWKPSRDRERERDYDVTRGGSTRSFAPRERSVLSQAAPTSAVYGSAQQAFSFGAPSAPTTGGSLQQNSLMSIESFKEPDEDVWTPRGAFRPPVVRRDRSAVSTAHSTQRVVPDDPVTAIARLQSFDGSFQLNDALRTLAFGDRLTLDALGATAPASIRSHPLGGQVWATAIAIAYLKTKAADQMDIWAGLWEKAYEYVVQALQGTTVSLDQLVDEAVTLL
ncbi:uncharacterized protein C8Q71DRAFT_862124 [Rhodofomes roseus]|uniref:Uncharacterized protein n=1 Tax=Rhodofomes roseus TaxID=34475 RepID=A0ABQ8K2J4_9APHY|nr:uncharacterized protein C8Q71DRAFT_862124 [Rhodofomes roseus]KAH9830990.1 hypothetical protein C8Q71DRAFT_862124 [Rhodofomes roseus]